MAKQAAWQAKLGTDTKQQGTRPLHHKRQQQLDRLENEASRVGALPMRIAAVLNAWAGWRQDPAAAQPPHCPQQRQLQQMQRPTAAAEADWPCC